MSYFLPLPINIPLHSSALDTSEYQFVSGTLKHFFLTASTKIITPCQSHLNSGAKDFEIDHSILFGVNSVLAICQF